ncbi:helix-turn-helix domain-containing protein [Pseudomonas aeruginosa]|uniref:helix-turn-helix domain-containing protein n=1 Tax=Pseudomonas aeruginosa TaxID=287 RepID=UPI000935F0B6|nr:helix-turn-helix transcriptional regulator [Pseudomonas aeruginosa]EIU7205280.1 helix-turn-helix transcriptional regulator [Pseudomonas aeruginosa]MBF1859995.1 helix-turn-helix transcriptional regulator [Pseudomonas aeruginosa]MBW6156862.1 helix-turn-helix domain-containing protein [Pseudomonas aeruginosa]MCO2581433.1 helix-turn-helix transcriptional regulator [Pseudomonas aeruginosa]MCO3774008.1 helix-turn-helix transcriptional regulator [Pseudomonas aeruginosa]
MKFSFPKEWCLSMARREIEAGREAHFGVGVTPIANAESAEHGAVSGTVLGRFIQLMRRKRRLTIERLAEEADIDLSELIEIEMDSHYQPQPRTIYFLAQYFDLPRAKLMELAGLVVPRDSHLSHAAIRFAASSDPLVELSDVERKALEEFVRELSK